LARGASGRRATADHRHRYLSAGLSGDVRLWFSSFAYFRETDDEPWSPIGDVPDELIELSE